MDPATELQFREFMEERSSALMRLAYLLTGGDQHAAEDLLQTALSKTLTRWSVVRSPEAYVRQVMYRQQVDFWQRTCRKRRSRGCSAAPSARSAAPPTVRSPGCASWPPNSTTYAEWRSSGEHRDPDQERLRGPRRPRSPP